MTILQDIRKGVRDSDYKALAKVLTIVENNQKDALNILKSLDFNSPAPVIGITGPPGAGKSTLANALIKLALDEDKKVALLAVDPSSPFNYGALLGDRIRLSEFYTHPNIFIRSIASRGSLGGLSASTIQLTDVVKNAGFDIVIIETVGVGQSEVEIAGLADCVLITLVPESGDEIQTMKAGLMEIGDLFILNKSDRPNSENFYNLLNALLHKKNIKAIKTVATENIGIKELYNSIKKILINIDNNPKKIDILQRQIISLLQEECTKSIDQTKLRTLLENHPNINLFNIYSFLNSLE